MVQYLPIAIFLLAAMAFPVVGLLISRILLQTIRPEKVKLEPYECGMKPEASARARISIHFYIVALLFVVFDVETIFLFPWAVLYDRLLIFGLVEMGIFISVLLIGYWYAWKKGALEWV